jgi:hypothetical protein
MEEFTGTWQESIEVCLRYNPDIRLQKVRTFREELRHEAESRLRDTSFVFLLKSKAPPEQLALIQNTSVILPHYEVWKY